MMVATHHDLSMYVKSFPYGATGELAYFVTEFFCNLLCDLPFSSRLSCGMSGR